MSQVIPPATTTKTIQSSATVSRLALRCDGLGQGKSRAQTDRIDSKTSVSPQMRLRRFLLSFGLANLCFNGVEYAVTAPRSLNGADHRCVP